MPRDDEQDESDRHADEQDPRNRPAGPSDRPGDRPSQGDRPVDRPRRSARRDDDRPDRRKGGVPVWVWVLLGIGGVLSVGSIGLTLAVIAWGAVAPQSEPAATSVVVVGMRVK